MESNFLFGAVYIIEQDYTDEEMRACVEGAYDSKFEENEIVPVVKAGDAYRQCVAGEEQP